ncbi:MAG: indolepyruvate ferredoxin oxidoreductase subunit alpha [Chloroflexi bacterium]|nr:indolepyruvate ferredoxin oxidoreductase subunit alpha [Chloroflexota bacterium]
MPGVEIDKPGQRLLLTGNEAIARGAIEAGVSFCSGYPGTPSSEIIETLSKVGNAYNLHAEWSTNEIVAIEAAGAVAFAGLRSICSMKAPGANVSSDFILTSNVTGTRAGFVIVMCDDPAAHSSTNEEDSRSYARLADIPLLEPATAQEAKDMTKWAFDLSEKLGIFCILRSVTRISHARSDIKLGEIHRPERTPSFTPQDRYAAKLPSVEQHFQLHKKLKQAQELFEESEFNWYTGPTDANFIIICCGTAWLYSREALEILGLNHEVGILKLGTTWPLPEELITKHLQHARNVLIVEETDPFLEQNVKVLAAELPSRGIGPINFCGKRSGDIPAVSEINVDLVIKALTKLKGKAYTPREQPYAEKAREAVESLAPKRALAFCPGCPHRASFWAIKTALKWDGRDGVVMGDIGCYSLGTGPAGFYLSQTLHCMGSGLGNANGLGNLRKFGFDHPVIAICGDSTFYHAAIPGLINAKHNGANVVLVLLDNSATAMTGFQPHPGIELNAMGTPAPAIQLEDICKGIGIEVHVRDPFDLKAAVEDLYQMLQQDGVKAMIFRRKCALVEVRESGTKKRVYINAEKCIGEDCGCARFCSRVFKCPGLTWDWETRKAMIDEVVCNGCGACVQLCPGNAIAAEEI